MWDDLKKTKPLPPEAVHAEAGRSEKIAVLAKVRASLRQSLEDMLFLPVAEEGMFMAELPVLSPIEGTVSILMTEPQARAMALGCYAVQPSDLTRDMVQDMVAELVNTVAGNLVASLLRSDQLFSLGLPSVTICNHIRHDHPQATFYIRLGNDVFQLVIAGDDLLGCIFG